MNTTHVRNSKSLAVAILATLHGAALAQQPLDPNKPVQVLAKDGKIDSPLYTVFGNVKIPGAPKDPITGVPKTGVNVRSYTLPETPPASNLALTPPMLPGPTFVFQPGDLLRLRFHNFLNRSTNPALNRFENNPQGGGPGSADDTEGHVSHEISIPNDSNITNLHVHGLHVDPKQDNVTLLILPEDTDPSGLIPELQRFVPTINRWWTRTYQYKLPADHLPGTFWYHAHKHGSTSTQVENGMAGSLLILPPDIQSPPDKQTRTIVPGLWNANPAKSHDRILMIQQIANFGARQGKGKGKANNINAPVTTINGQYQPTLELPATQVERWRLVVAGGNHTTSGYLWVGGMKPVISANTQAALKAITTQANATPYTSGTTFFPDVTTFQCSALPGVVKVVAADGIDIWQPRDITAGTPALGSTGNRLDLLVQAGTPATGSGPYGIYLNYPADQRALAAAYPDLFGPAAVPAGAADARFAALSQGQQGSGGLPAFACTDGAKPPGPETDIASITPVAPPTTTANNPNRPNPPYNVTVTTVKPLNIPESGGLVAITGTSFNGTYWAAPTGKTTFSTSMNVATPATAGKVRLLPVLPPGVPLKLPAGGFNTDTYQLGSNYLGQADQLWTGVNNDGTPLPNGGQAGPATSPAYMPVAPLLKGAPGPGGKGVIINEDFPKFVEGAVGWQSMPDANGSAPVTNAILVKLSITDKSKATGPTTIPANAKLNEIASSLSPAGTGSRLEKVDPRTRTLVPGIPSYVSPIPDSAIAGRQVAVFDRGQFTFNYTDKATQQVLQFRQFWITGRQFNADDWVGNPATTSLINQPLVNVEPWMGEYSPTAAANAWTHQKQTTKGKTLIITNPGYTMPLKKYTIAGQSQPAYNYDYSNPKTPTYKSLTGLDEPHTPVSTTAEEWLLVNNSDLFHPFHIHINPFFVTEIGQLNYTKGATPEWSVKKLTLADKGNSAVPFSWIVGNWWDVITLPPHGYVRMRMWINVPSQLPANVDDKVPDNDLTVYDNANVYGSWVMHCHILRHEDRGMMSMVNTEPKAVSLTGKWTQDAGGTSEIADDHGGLRITPLPPTPPPVTPAAPPYNGTFSRGVSNPLFSQPWLGSMSPPAAVLSFCVTENAKELLLSNGHLWASGTAAPAKIIFAPGNLDLSGNWADDKGNIATITQSPTNPTTGIAALTFTPVSTVWWRIGKGSWVPAPPPAGTPPVPTPVVYAGTQTVVNDAKQNQSLTFCVSGDLKTIVFGNGVKWKKQ